MSDPKNPDNGDNTHAPHTHDHDHECGEHHHHHHNHQDENLNYPFHYHYELQKLMGEQEAPVFDLPEVIFDMRGNDVAPAHSKELMRFIKNHDSDEGEIDWVFLSCRLDEEGFPVLSPSIDHPEIEPTPLEDALDWLIDSGIHAILMIEPVFSEEVESDETETTAVILDVISRSWDSDCPNLLVATDHLICMATAQEIAPYWPKGFIINQHFIESNFEGLGDFIKQNNISALFLDASIANEERVALLMEFDKPVGIFMQEEDVLSAKRILKWGASSLISPTANILLENL